MYPPVYHPRNRDAQACLPVHSHGCGYSSTHCCALHIPLRGHRYRGVGMAAVRAGVALDDAEALAQLAAALDVGGLSADAQLRSEDAGAAASKVSVHPAVRAALLDAQRAFAMRPPGEYCSAVGAAAATCVAQQPYVGMHWAGLAAAILAQRMRTSLPA